MQDLSTSTDETSPLMSSSVVRKVFEVPQSKRTTHQRWIQTASCLSQDPVSGSHLREFVVSGFILMNVVTKPHAGPSRPQPFLQKHHPQCSNFISKPNSPVSFRTNETSNQKRWGGSVYVGPYWIKWAAVRTLLSSSHNTSTLPPVMIYCVECLMNVCEISRPFGH